MSISATELATLRDEELLMVMAQGHAEALGALYDRYCRLTYTLALSITGDRNIADGVMQDVFQSAWQDPGTLCVTAGSVEGWLVERIRSQAIAMVRGSYRQAHPQDVAITRTRPDAWRDDDREHPGAIRADVYSAVNVLSPSQRHIAALAYFGGLRCPEIASQLGMSVTVVKRELLLGLSLLRRALLPQQDSTIIADRSQRGADAPHRGDLRDPKAPGSPKRN